MDAQQIKKRAALVKWFLLAALLPLLVMIVGSVPAIIALTGKIVPAEVEQKALLAIMLLVPLLAIFLMLPLVKLLGRSILLWGLGIVLLPLGPYFCGMRLLYLASRSQSAASPGVQAGQP